MPEPEDDLDDLDDLDDPDDPDDPDRAGSQGSAALAPRVVAHLDMDAFYASVELLRRPDLRGRPVVVGGRRRIAPDADGSAADPAETGPIPVLRDYAGRGVITTATYEARALGVHSGMGLMKAAQLAPDALLLPADFDRYRLYSRRFKDAVRTLAPQVEDRGIDRDDLLNLLEFSGIEAVEEFARQNHIA